LLRSINSQIKTKNRGEQAAAEVLSRNLEHNEFGAVLLFEDSAIRKANFLTRLPDSVVVTSTSEFLFGLESRGLIASAQAILDQAVDVRGEPAQDWAVRMRLAP